MSEKQKTSRGLKALRVGISVVGVLLVGLSSWVFLTPGKQNAVQAAATTTVSFVAHQDDDLLFMNPDIASDVQAGYNTWVVYLTAGDVPYRAGKTYGGMEYADMRIQGERAAYARAAKKPNNWIYEPMTFGGRQVATNRLSGTNVHLVFTFMHAAAGPEDNCGDLYRMLKDSNYVAQPIDGRPAYNKASYTAMLKSIIQTLNPAYIRSQSTIGHRDPAPDVDHVDHTAGAILTANADTTTLGKTLIRRDEYLGYVIRSSAYANNVSGYWKTEKTAIWNKYLPYDPELAPGAWANVMGKQYRLDGRIFMPGTAWVAPGDFTCQN